MGGPMGAQRGWVGLEVQRVWGETHEGTEELGRTRGVQRGWGEPMGCRGVE